MNSDGLLDDETVLDQLADSKSGVSQRDLVSLIRVKPYAVLTATSDGSSESLLQFQGRHSLAAKIERSMEQFPGHVQFKARSRKPDWSSLSCLGESMIDNSTRTIDLMRIMDELVQSDFKNTTDIYQLKRVVLGLQCTCEMLIDSRKRLTDANATLQKENDLLKQVEHQESRLTLAKVDANYERCPDCGKKFRDASYLSQHIQRRHQQQPLALPQVSTDRLDGAVDRMLAVLESQSRSNADLLPAVNALADDLSHTRELLAGELQNAVKRALELHALVPPGHSWTGELDLSGSFLTPSPPSSPRVLQN